MLMETLYEKIPNNNRNDTDYSFSVIYNYNRLNQVTVVSDMEIGKTKLMVRIVYHYEEGKNARVDYYSRSPNEIDQYLLNYFDNDDLIKQEYHDADGVLLSKLDYSYYGDNSLKVIRTYDKNGNLTYYTQYQYVQDTTKLNRYLANGNLISTQEIVYDSMGRKSEEAKITDGDRLVNRRYFYDNLLNRLNKIIIYEDSEGAIFDIQTYEYY